MQFIIGMTYGEILAELAQKMNTLFALNGEYNDCRVDAAELDSESARERMGEIVKERVTISARVKVLAFNIGIEDYTADAIHATKWGLFPLAIPELKRNDNPALFGMLYYKMPTNGKGTGKIVANL